MSRPLYLRIKHSENELLIASSPVRSEHFIYQSFQKEMFTAASPVRSEHLIK